MKKNKSTVKKRIKASKSKPVARPTLAGVDGETRLTKSQRDEHVNKLLTYLIELAKRGQVVTYSEIARSEPLKPLGIKSYRRIVGELIREASRFSVRVWGINFGALVVNKETGYPGPRFYELAAKDFGDEVGKTERERREYVEREQKLAFARWGLVKGIRSTRRRAAISSRR